MLLDWLWSPIVRLTVACVVGQKAYTAYTAYTAQDKTNFYIILYMSTQDPTPSTVGPILNDSCGTSSGL